MFNLFSSKKKDSEKAREMLDDVQKKKKLDEEIEKLTGTKYETSIFTAEKALCKTAPLIRNVKSNSDFNQEMRINADIIKKEISDHVDKEIKRFKESIFIERNNADIRLQMP